MPRMYKCLLIEGSYNLEKYIAQMHNDIKNMIPSYTTAVLLNLNTVTIVYNNTFLFTSLIVIIITERSHGF